MKLKQIVFTSQEKAEAINPKDTWAVISIRCPGDEVNLHKEWKVVLPLEFDDLDKFYSGYTLFSEEQANQILDLVENNDDIDCLVVHCAAGISRSATVALFIKEYYADYLEDFWTQAAMYNRYVYNVLKYTYEQRQTDMLQ